MFNPTSIILDKQTGKWKLKRDDGKRIPLRKATAWEREQWDNGNRGRPDDVVDLALSLIPVDHRVDHRRVDLHPDAGSIFNFLDWWDTEFPKTRRPLTVEKFRRELKRFRSYLGVDRPIIEVDHDVVGGYVDHRRKTVQPQSIITELNSLSSMFKAAVDREIITKNPCKRHLQTLKKAYPPQDKIKYLDADEIQSFLAKLDTLVNGGTVGVDHADAMRLMLATGMRVSAVVALRWDWITADGRIEIPPEPGLKTKTGYSAAVSKGGLEVLARRRLGGSEGRVFPKNITRNGMFVQMTRNFPGVNPHRLRHSFATALTDNGMAIHTIAAMMGQTDLKTTQIYARVRDAAKLDAAKSLPF